LPPSVIRRIPAAPLRVKENTVCPHPSFIENILQGRRLILARVSRDGSFMYDFEQYVCNVPGKKDWSIGLFGRFGVGYYCVELGDMLP